MIYELCCVKLHEMLVLDMMNRTAVGAPGHDGKCRLWNSVSLLIDQLLRELYACLLNTETHNCITQNTHVKICHK
jgi:hypothetical protein